MNLLIDTPDQSLCHELNRAWSAPATFALLPQKSGVSPEWLNRVIGTVPEELDAGHFALLTSGSTGAPKLVIGSRERSERLVETLHSLQGSEPVAETIQVLPLTYSYAFINQWLWSRQFNRRLVTTAGFRRPEQLHETLCKASDAMLCLVGVQVPLLVRHFHGHCYPGVIRVHFAGGRFPQENLDVVRAFFPSAKIFNNFGCAEAMPRLTLRAADDADEAADVGRPLPGVELKTGPAGELLFRSPYGAVAMVERERFSPITPDAWVPTGDLGEPTEKGTWRITGRASDVFKRHGEKISLATLLATVNDCWPGNAACYRETDRSGEEGYVLVLAPHCGKDEVRGILGAFRAGHPRARWPLRIESVADMPLLANGKVDVLAIPKLDARTVHWHQRI